MTFNAKLVGLGLVCRMVATCAIAAFVTVGASATTYYISFTDGSNANNGTAKATPWKFCPKMVGFSHAYTHVAGDTFVLKGSDTWPVTCFQMLLDVGGSSDSVRDTYTADPTWYRGASFSRPLFDFQDTEIASGYNADAGILIVANYITFDNLEMAHHRGHTGDAGWGACTVNLLSANSMTFTNCMVRDWSLPMPLCATCDNDGTGGIVSFNQGGGGHGNVITHCTFHQSGTTCKTGTAAKDVGNVNYTDIYDTSQAYLGGGNFHHNHFYNLRAPSASAQHGNSLELFSASVIYNNLIHDLDSHVAAPIFAADWSPGTYGTNLFYNNIIFNTSGQVCVGMDTGGNNTVRVGLQAYNNTFVNPGACIAVSLRLGNQWFGLLDFRNNHFISDTASPVQYNTAANPSQFPLQGRVTTIINQNNLTNTLAQAAAAGYSAANNYSPQNSSAPTINIGQNLSSVYTTDYYGASRTGSSTPFDAGAFEWQGSVPSNPGNLSLSSTTYTTAENVTLNVIVSRMAGSTGTVGATVTASSGGTAVDGTDYTATSGTISMGSGTTSATFPITILRNVSFTGNRYFTVTLSAATGSAMLIAPTTATVTITDTDSPPSVIPQFATAITAQDMQINAPFYATNSAVYYPTETDATNSAGSLVCYFVVPTTGSYRMDWFLNAPSGSANSFNVMVNSVNDISDINPLTTGFELRQMSLRDTGTFDANGRAPALFSLTGGATNALTIYGREAGITLSNMTWVLLSGPTVTQTLSIESAAASVFDNAGSLVLLVNRGGTNTGTISCNYATADGTALNGTDYTSTSGTLSFTDGVASRMITIPIVPGTNWKAPGTFTVTLSSPSGASVIAPSVCTVTVNSHFTQLFPPISRFGGNSKLGGLRSRQ